MRLFNRSTKYPLACTFLWFFLTAVAASAQTPITAFPLTGNLAAGTHLYQIPNTLVSPGSASAVLDFTPPDGGASMTVTFSGPDCCPPEAYLGESTGLARTVRLATTFNVPSRQIILVTIDVAVASKHTVGFRLNYTSGSATGSGIIVTPPAPSPTPPATLPDAALCTDLGLTGFYTIPLTLYSKKIGGVVVNATPTHQYKGYEHRQWVEVRDITDSETRPPLVARIWLPTIIASGRSIPFAAVHTWTGRRRPRYEVRIVYSPLNATDESQYNDDCRAMNNSTRRELINTALDESKSLEPVPKQP